MGMVYVLLFLGTAITLLSPGRRLAAIGPLLLSVSVALVLLDGQYVASGITRAIVGLVLAGITWYEAPPMGRPHLRRIGSQMTATVLGARRFLHPESLLLPLRAIIIALTAVAAGGLATAYPFPDATRPMVIAGYWLISAGLFHLVLVREIRTIGNSLLVMEAGLYALGVGRVFDTSATGLFAANLLPLTIALVTRLSVEQLLALQPRIVQPASLDPSPEEAEVRPQESTRQRRTRHRSAAVQVPEQDQ